VRAGSVPVDVVVKASVLAVQPLEHRFVVLSWGSLTHRTSLPSYFELLAQSRGEPAYFVVARRGKNASAPSSSARRRAISRRSQLGALLGIGRQFPAAGPGRLR
jgi:hypothetical protein